MALVTISGYPCCGKTARSKQLQLFLQRKQALPVVLVNDETLNLNRAAYDAAATEKPARAALFSAVTRALGQDKIVICDAMNYIKGFRYQLYCAAREARCRTCTVQIAAPPERCRHWNAARKSNKYSNDTLDNLITRYEEPSSFARWDSPLITIPWEDVDLPEQSLMEAITKGELRPPNQATIVAVTGTTDYLHVLESTAGSVCSALLIAQAASPGGGMTTFAVSADTFSSKMQLMLPARGVTMPQLQRMKRQFVTLQKQTAKSTEMSSKIIADLFVKFIADSLPC